MWLDPNLSLRWGPYFKPGADDESKVTKSAIQAKSAGLITRRTGVERIAPYFDIENIDSYLDALEEEEEKSEAKALEMAQAMGSDEDGEPSEDEDEDEGDDAPESKPPSKLKSATTKPEP